MKKASHKVQIAVSFVSDFAKLLLAPSATGHLKEVQLINCFDNRSLSSFDLPTMLALIKSGFILRFHNSIHLKLYNNRKFNFVSSSNLTRGGFENNIELTVQIENRNHDQCRKIFDDLWKKSAPNEITETFIKKNGIGIKF